MTRTPAQIGKANREAGKRAERKVAQYLEAHGLGNGRRNLAGYARDHGEIVDAWNALEASLESPDD